MLNSDCKYICECETQLAMCVRRYTIDSITCRTRLETFMCSYSVPYIHTYPMHVAKNAWNSHHLGCFFRLERRSKQIFQESPQSQDKDTLLYSIIVWYVSTTF